eukprot:TRINITY_DN14407_c0_g2_i1.p3 TRINITY_DN14407_c0_g2~~TRINITY_DN14407_c0_g2_i1.p3  ORF type:complete len:108 (-),score=30.44 TRINITY_DN14407_c0_g2_i1:730-1053(-)
MRLAHADSLRMAQAAVVRSEGAACERRIEQEAPESAGGTVMTELITELVAMQAERDSELFSRVQQHEDQLSAAQVHAEARDGWRAQAKEEMKGCMHEMYGVCAIVCR